VTDSNLYKLCKHAHNLSFYFHVFSSNCSQVTITSTSISYGMQTVSLHHYKVHSSQDISGKSSTSLAYYVGKHFKRVSLEVVLFHNSTIKLIFPSLHYNITLHTIMNYMIQFYHQATFKALTSLLILPHSWIQIFFQTTTGRWRACSFQNYSKNTDSTLLYFAVFGFLQRQLFTHTQTEKCIF